MLIKLILVNYCIISIRYKNHISSEQRDALLEIARIHTHKFTHEIRRELTNAKCRDLEVAEPMEK